MKPEDVLKRGATEPPFSGKYVHCDERGIYRCAGCGQQLFSSDEKFDSGTGWPSFSAALSGTIETREDNSHGMQRTEVVCSECKGHLGHLFPDGPKGARYCINSLALQLETK